MTKNMQDGTPEASRGLHASYHKPLSDLVASVLWKALLKDVAAEVRQLLFDNCKPVTGGRSMRPVPATGMSWANMETFYKAYAMGNAPSKCDQ
jgi:hypothetical protein